MISRLCGELIQSSLDAKKVIILSGARQTGKTTLLKSLFDERTEPALWFNGDELDVQELFARLSAQRFKDFVLEGPLFDQFPDLFENPTV